MKRIRVAINGFGRIGRSFFRLSFLRPEIEIVALNDLANLANLAYLLKYDSAYGRAPFEVSVAGSTDGQEQSDDTHVAGRQSLVINGTPVIVLNEKDATKLPWKELGIDIVVESTGIFASYEKSKVHLDAGATRVVITAPVKDEPPDGLGGATVLMGINDDALATCSISSNASCTTNGASPLIQILDEAIGIERAILNTVHGYTASQALVDSPSKKDLREGRAAAVNIVPSSTGAAIAVTKAIPGLAGKFDGISLRVPIVTGSMVDVTFVAKRPTSVEEVNAALKRAAQDERWQKIFAVTEEPLVSTDIIGIPYASLADIMLTRVVDGTLVKVMAWYDNEAGYTHALIEHVIKSGSYL